VSDSPRPPLGPDTGASDAPLDDVTRDARLAALGRRELVHAVGVTPLSVDRVLRGRVFDVGRAEVRLPSGLEQSYDIVLHGGAAAVVAVHEGRVLCVRQYRIPAGDWLLEIPAGRLEPGEDPLLAAQRELEEETGYRARSWRLLRRFFPAVGFCTEVMYLYLAEGLEEVGAGKLAADDDEELEVVWATPEQLLAARMIHERSSQCVPFGS
jgi:ADP-ribose pyrophosphatase